MQTIHKPRFSSIRMVWFAVGLVLANFLSPCCFGGGIQLTNGGFLFSGSNYSVGVSGINGSILSVVGAGGSGSIVHSGEYGLWLVTNELGDSIDANEFSSSSTSNIFSWSLPAPSNVLFLNYSNAAIAVTVTLSNLNNGIALAAQVHPRIKTVTEFDLPARLRFSPTNVQRLICPLNSSDGVGASFNAGFFQAQPNNDPASWDTVTEGDTGYISLYGGELIFGPTVSPPVPVSFTSAGTNWLGETLTSIWTGSNAIVNRAPAAGQADLVLVSSTNGDYFSASHLGGAGYIFRLGGEVDANSIPIAQTLVLGAIQHLMASAAAGRTNVALINLLHGPSSGGWAAVPVATWSNLLGSAVAAQPGLQFVQLQTVQAMLAANTSTNYLAIVNPYGEWMPALSSSEYSAAVSSIGSYVKGGGNWFETGGHSFYYALLPYQYYSYSTLYPPAFADFFQFETMSGNATLFGVQPSSAIPWEGVSDPAALFVPGRLAWGADTLGGYCERAFGTYVAPGQTWQTPMVQLSIGYTAPQALSAYCQANAYSTPLSNKMSSAKLNSFKNSVLVYYAGDCAEKIAYLTNLPSPALVHFADYLPDGFDHWYPDYLPPAASFGTASEFTNFLEEAHELGLLVMPYTNPTWWPDDPPGPTFQADGTNALVIELDGSLSYEIYGANYGYTVCQWHPEDQAANSNAVEEFSTSYPVDVLFEDQCGARTWEYDMNPASPTPFAYSAGIASRVAEDSETLPISTEDGWDRLVNTASQFCGMAWATVPTINPPTWQSFLRDRYSTSTWDIYPVAEYIAHDKVSMVLHDLGQFVTSDEQLAWTLGLGYGLSYTVNAPDLSEPATSQWLLWLDRVQKSVCSLYVGQPMTSFSHNWGTVSDDADNGFIQTSYGALNILANLDSHALMTNGQTLAAYGFSATAPGMVAGIILPDAGMDTNPTSFVTQASGSNAQFWVYTTGEQQASIPLPSGLGGTAIVQLDGNSAMFGQSQNASVSVGLGMTPTLNRTEPAAALAGKPPVNWGVTPKIGILNIPGMASAWTTITAGDWENAFSTSSLSTEFGLPIVEITNFNELTAALQAGPTNWFAIINPCGEVFPESGEGQWSNTLSLIENYVDNGGCWWETAGYSFYTATWLESGTWETETAGPSGLDTFGIPVGGGANNQPAEALSVTATGQTFFGAQLSTQLQGMTSTVNRGLLRGNGDPGHIALLAGAEADFVGAYRLNGWGYLWRIGGFLPNPEVVLPAVPAAMAYLYTNAPLPALVSSVEYLWHGTITFVPQPVLQASELSDGLISFQISNCPVGATNYLERTPVLGNSAAWQIVLTFSSPASATNWTDTNASGFSSAFYRVVSSVAP
ncbi:MAG TPA: DUF6259 domain-containing protein [Verrucomicrobiae bacterium]